MRIYTPNEIDIISQVQTVALSTALPTVLAILTLFVKKGSEPSKPKWAKIEKIKVSEIIKNVEEFCATNLADRHYPPSEKFIKSATHDLINKGFLVSGKPIIDELKQTDELSLTDKGVEAARLLLSIEIQSNKDLHS